MWVTGAFLSKFADREGILSGVDNKARVEDSISGELGPVQHRCARSAPCCPIFVREGQTAPW
jgi:hypothetical protein